MLVNQPLMHKTSKETKLDKNITRNRMTKQKLVIARNYSHITIIVNRPHTCKNIGGGLVQYVVHLFFIQIGNAILGRINAPESNQQVQTIESEILEEDLFVASCFSNKDTGTTWFIDNECINHITFNATIFMTLIKAL